jgi:hypothetical protein
VGVVSTIVVGRALADDCEMAIAAVGIAVVVPIIVGSRVAVVGVDVDVDDSPVAAMMVGRGVADRSAAGVVVVVVITGVAVIVVVCASGTAGAKEGSLVVRRGVGCFVSFCKECNTMG